MKKPKKKAEVDPNKHEVISVYVPTELKQRAEIVARRQGHKLSQFIRWVLERAVADDQAGDIAPRRQALRHQPGLFKD